MEPINTPVIHQEPMLLDHLSAIAIPPGWKVESTESHQLQPSRQNRDIILYDLDSFIKYIEDHRYGGIQLFEKERYKKIKCVFNPSIKNKQDWGDDTVTLILQESQTLCKWTEFQSSVRSREEFSEFIENNINDIVKPDGQEKMPTALEVLKMASEFEEHSSLSFKSRANLDNGAQEVTLTKSDNPGLAKVKFHPEFYIAVQPYDFQDTPQKYFPIKIRVRYRVKEGKLSFLLAFTNFIIERDQRYRDVCRQIETKLDNKIYF